MKHQHRIALAAVVAAFIGSGFVASSASADLGYQYMCAVAANQNFGATEYAYEGGPIRGNSWNQAHWLLTTWGASANPSWGGSWYRESTNAAVCVTDYNQVGAFGARYHVWTETRVVGHGTVAQTFIDKYYNTARVCYVDGGGEMSCGRYGSVDGNTSF